MDLYIYSDESGVFDKVHNEYFVYGGIIFLSKESKDICARKYLAAEKVIRNKEQYKAGQELKASILRNGEKGKLYRSLNQEIRFGIIIRQEKVFDRIFGNKKDKQRYLDYAYKMGLKMVFVKLMAEKRISAEGIDNLYVFVDEHTTATNGRYELRECLEQEFKSGTYNYSYDCFYEPIFKSMKNVNLQFCNSAKKPLIRAADIIANKVYHMAINGKTEELSKTGVYLVFLP